MFGKTVLTSLVSLALLLTGNVHANAGAVGFTGTTSAITPGTPYNSNKTVAVTNGASGSTPVPYAAYSKAALPVAGSGNSYTFSYLGQNVTTAITGSVAAAAGGVTIVSNLACPVCPTFNYSIPWTTWNFAFNITTGTGSPTPNIALSVVQDYAISATNSSADVTFDATNDATGVQPGKFIFTTVAANATAGAGSLNAISYVLTTAAAAPFNAFSVVGGGLCPVVPAVTDNVFRASWTVTTTGAGDQNFVLMNVTAGTYWGYLANSSLNTLSGAGNVITAEVSNTLPRACGTATASGFCPASSASNPSLASFVNVTANGASSTTARNITVNPGVPHSAWGITSFQSFVNQSYTYTFSGPSATAASGTTVTPSANYSNVAPIVSTLQCTACSSLLNATTAYTWSTTFYLNSTGAVNSGIIFTQVLTDTNINLTNGTNVSLAVPAADVTGSQRGKYYFFVIPQVNVSTAATSASYKNNVTIAINAASNPFSSIQIVGNNLCPLTPATTDNITRYSTSLSGTNISTSLAFTNISGGTYWLYLAPSSNATLAVNGLGVSDVISMTYFTQNSTSCIAGTNGFCSGAATLKTAASAIVAVTVAVFFALF